MDPLRRTLSEAPLRSWALRVPARGRAASRSSRRLRGSRRDCL